MAKYLSLPRPQDDEKVGGYKLIKFIDLNFGSSLGCIRSNTFLKQFMIQTLCEIKTGVLEEAIKKGGQNV